MVYIDKIIDLQEERQHSAAYKYQILETLSKYVTFVS